MDPNFNPHMMTPEAYASWYANTTGFNPPFNPSFNPAQTQMPANVARNLFPNPGQVPQSQYYHSPNSQPHQMYSQPDVEFVAETQPESMPKTKSRSRKGKEAFTGKDDATNARGTGRNVAWSENEDLVLLRCYMDVCSDPIVGTNQRYGTLFKKIHEKYEDARKDAMITELIYRTQDSLRKRVGRIKEEMNHWLASYERAENAVGQRSGYNDNDVLSTAQKFHKENTKFHNGFSMFNQWDLLKKYPEYDKYLNWETILRKKEHQTTDLDDDVANERESTGGSSGTKRYRLVDDDSVSSPKRPMGRDKAKRMGKSSTSINSDADGVSQGWSQFNENYPHHIELERKKFEWKMSNEEKKLAVRMEEVKNQKRAQLVALWDKYPSLTAQQRAFADKLAAELESDY